MGISHPLTSLVIANSGTESTTVVLKAYRTARALSIEGPSALTGTVKVEGQGADDTWRTVQVAEADLNVTALDITLVDYPGRFKAVRVVSGSSEGAERTFPVQVIYELT
jgi:fructose-specific phosphotransferase system component IIB